MERIEDDADVANMINDQNDDWEEEYFKKFDWLSASVSEYEITPQLNFWKSLADLAGNNCDPLSYYPESQRPEDRMLYLYYIALENNKMLLYADFKKPHHVILNECVDHYEFARVNKPVHIVNVLENIDFFDVDKNVKIFMQMFGIDETRGGSYSEVRLPYHVRQTLERELKIASLDYYVESR